MQLNLWNLNIELFIKYRDDYDNVEIEYKLATIKGTRNKREEK